MGIEFEPSPRAVHFGRLKISWRLFLRAGARRSPPRRGVEWYDADRIGPTAQLRHWQPGDRFQPIGMAVEVRLQDLLTNLKIPREKRRDLVVATTAEGQIWWVEGLRMGEAFKLTAGTRRRLRWQWSRETKMDSAGSGEHSSEESTET